DFADIFEVKSNHIVRRGRITTSWSEKRQAMHMTYRNKDFRREVIVRTGEGDGEPTVNANGRLSFDVALKAGQAWHRCLIYDLVDGAKQIRAPRKCTHSSETSDHASKMDEWGGPPTTSQSRQNAAVIDAASMSQFGGLHHQSVSD